jgi:predicted dehydrogenase
MGQVEHAPLWDIGTHHLDLLRTRVGRAPDEISAQVTRAETGVTYVLTLTWRDGPTAIYSHREGGPVFHHHEWLEGEHAGLSVDAGRVLIVSPTNRPRRVRVPRRDRAERRLLDALVQEPSGAAATAMSAGESLGTLGMVEAAVRSLELEAPVEPAALAAAQDVVF